MSIYDRYVNCVEQLIEAKDLRFFKGFPDYTYMLEHVSKQQGVQYLEHIQKNTTITAEQIKEFCALNDRLGGPSTHPFSVCEASPTSMRYIYHAHLILSHFNASAPAEGISLVEVGGGYGGLCLAISFFAAHYGVKINRYHIVDLDTITKLQALYLQTHTLSFPVEFHSATQYGAEITDTPLYLISNYCFSEIPSELQTKYREILFPKVTHGFMTWNMIPLYDFGKQYSSEEESPKTGTMNYYVRF